MIIRQVELKDVEYCAAIEEACFEPSEAASLEKIKVRAELFPHGFIVGELDGKIVGMINSGATAKSDITDEALKAMSSHDPEGRNLVIFSIAVAPDHQGKGVGSFMITQITKLRPNIYAKVKLDNISSVKAFEKAGYEKKYFLLEPKK